jgi:UDP-2,3-diacylglucosamine hydrolase
VSPAIAHVFGDLHLDPAGGPEVEAFCSWVRSVESPRLVILGDLFEAWFGPRTASLAGAREVLASLMAATARGIAIEVVPGNRDFLLGEGFEARTGATLHAGGLALEGASRRTLILHGDELCTRDHGYLRLRRVLRSPLVARLAALLPRWAGAAVAARLRRASVQAVASKPAEEKAMQPEAAVEAAQRAGAALLIVGHAHEFALRTPAPGLEWVVLDGWGGERDVAELSGDGTWRAVAHGDLPRWSAVEAGQASSARS